MKPTMTRTRRHNAPFHGMHGRDKAVLKPRGEHKKMQAVRGPQKVTKGLRRQWARMIRQSPGGGPIEVERQRGYLA